LQGSCQNNGSWSLDGAGSTANEAQLIVEGGGTMNCSGSLTIGTNIRTTKDSVLDLKVGAQFNAAGKNSLLIELSGESIGPDAITVMAGGSDDVFGTLTEGPGGHLDNFGTVTIEPGAVLNDNGAVTVEAGGLLDVFGTLAVGSGGALDIYGTVIVERGASYS